MWKREGSGAGAWSNINYFGSLSPYNFESWRIRIRNIVMVTLLLTLGSNFSSLAFCCSVILSLFFITLYVKKNVSKNYLDPVIYNIFPRLKMMYKCTRKAVSTIKQTHKKIHLKSQFYLVCTVTSVPDPKLIISDLDPQIENQEFRIMIFLSTSDGEKKF